MSGQFCSCPDRNTCRCQPMPPYYSAPYYSPAPTPHPQAWPQYSHLPGLQPTTWGTFGSTTTAQPQWNNTFSDSYNRNNSDSDSPAFRVALGDATSSTVNTDERSEPITQTGNKRKRGSGTTSGRKRANNRDIVPTPTPVAHTPAVHGVGPSSNPIPSNPTLNPAFNHTPGPSTNFGSLVETGTGCTTGATDVWYFVQGVNSKTKPVQPQNNKVSGKRPSPKEFAFLACRLCKCVYNIIFFLFYLQTSIILGTMIGQVGKMLKARLMLFAPT